MSSLTLEVSPRGKPLKGLPQDLTVSSQSSAAQVYDAIAAKTKASVHRIRITKGSDGAVLPNSSDTTIRDTGLLDGSKIVVKDLGELRSKAGLPNNSNFIAQAHNWAGNSSTWWNTLDHL